MRKSWMIGLLGVAALEVLAACAQKEGPVLFSIFPPSSNNTSSTSETLTIWGENIGPSLILDLESGEATASFSVELVHRNSGAVFPWPAPVVNPDGGISANLTIGGGSPMPQGDYDVVFTSASGESGVLPDGYCIGTNDLNIGNSPSYNPSTKILTYSVIVQNTKLDNVAADDVIVLDLLDPRLQYKNHSPPEADYDPDTGMWSVGTLAAPGQPGNSASLTINADATAASGNIVDNIARVFHSSPCGKYAESSAPFDVP